MAVYYYLILLTYIMLIISYIIIKHRKIELPYRASVKLSLVAMFVSMALLQFLVRKDALSLTLLVALIMAGVGDYLLLFKKYFNIGVVAFGLANLILIIYTIIRHNPVWWVWVVWVALNIVSIVLQRCKIYRYGKSVIFLNIYLPLITLTGSIGLGILFNTTNTTALVMGSGMVSFMVSDILLGTCYFIKNKWYLDAMQTVAYFGGMFLIAISGLLGIVL